MAAAAVAIASAVAGAAVAASPAVIAAITTVGAAVLGAVVAVAVSYVGSAVLGLNDTDSSSLDSSSSDRTEMIREAITYRRTVYGEVCLSGKLTYIYVSANNYNVYLLLTLSEHPLNDIGTLYFDDEEVELALCESWSAGSYDAGAIVYYSGSYYQRTDTAYSNETYYDVDGHLLTGDLVTDEKPPDAPTLWTETDAPDDTYEWYGTGDYSGLLTVWAGLGDDGDGDAALLAELVDVTDGEWTEDHQQTGCGKLLLKLIYDSSVYSSGIPTPTVLVQGKAIYDPRTTETAYSANWALCVADYLTGDHGVACQWTEIDQDMLADAADVCDEEVELASGDTRPRYECHGTLNQDTARGDAIEDLTTAGAGWVVWSGGLWRIWPGAFRDPVVTLDEDNLDGSLTVQPWASRSDIFNSLRATFVNAANSWEDDDAPPRQDETYIAEDGEAIWEDMEFPFSVHSDAVQRLMKIALETVRQQMVVDYPCNLSAMRLRAGDIVMVNNDRRGWVGKTFLITQWALAMRDGDIPRMGVDLTLRECSANGAEYAWDVSEEVEADTDVTLSTGTSTPAQPSNFAVSSQPYEMPNGDLVPGLLATWDAPDDALIVAYTLRWRLMPSTTYVGSKQAETTREYLFPLVSGGSYKVEIASKNVNGAQSDWLVSDVINVVGDTTAPEVIADLAASVDGDAVTLTWTTSSDYDFSLTKLYRSAEDDFDDATSVGTVYGLPGTSQTWSQSGLDAGNWYYWAVAVDTTGNAADASASALATVE